MKKALSLSLVFSTLLMLLVLPAQAFAGPVIVAAAGAAISAALAPATIGFQAAFLAAFATNMALSPRGEIKEKNVDPQRMD